WNGMGALFQAESLRTFEWNECALSSGICKWQYIDRDTHDVISMIVFTRHGSCWYKDIWPHAALFENIIDRWVRVVGNHPDAYSNLIALLNGPGWTLVPEPALTWLSICIPSSGDLVRFWRDHDNAERTARLLLRIWENKQDLLHNEHGILQRYSVLVDQLVEAGIPLASILQQQLEQSV
ncbi:MAG TPA: hypothetical protein VKU00_12635, partial [Chthonomonadaceae bacterium]|nr:hypothetical protein [Chthonomonadaceae bacterium]